MGSRLDTRLKKLESKSPADPMTIVVMRYGTMPTPEEADRAIREARVRGINLRFELYRAPGLTEAEQKAAYQGVKPPPGGGRTDDLN